MRIKITGLLVQYVAVLPTSIMTPGCPATGGLTFLSFTFPATSLWQFCLPPNKDIMGLSGSGIFRHHAKYVSPALHLAVDPLRVSTPCWSPRASLSLLTEFLSSCHSSLFTRSPSAQLRTALSLFVHMQVCVRACA